MAAPAFHGTGVSQMAMALGLGQTVIMARRFDPLETLRLVRPHVLVKGQDYGIDKVVGRELVEADGGRVALIPLLSERSTTALVERIRNRG